MTSIVLGAHARRIPRVRDRSDGFAEGCDAFHSRAQAVMKAQWQEFETDRVGGLASVPWHATNDAPGIFH